MDPLSDRPHGNDTSKLILDGSSVTASTNSTSATIYLKGYSVSPLDVGKFLAVRGGTNFAIGIYLILSIDSGSNAWTLDRHCTIGAGSGMTGKLINQKGRWHDPVLEFFQADLPNGPSQGIARQCVLDTLILLKPEILNALADTCLSQALLEPDVADNHDWHGPLDCLLWAHVQGAGQIEPSTGVVVFGNLTPFRDALKRWAKDESRKRWDLCDNKGEPVDWVADAAVQTLVFWKKRERLPKKLKWENHDFHAYRSLDSEDAYRMFDMELRFDAGSGFVRLAPEHGTEYSRLSDRAQRAAKAEYTSLGQKLGLTRMQQVSERYFEWYVLQTFLGFKLREIRERERKRGVSLGDPQDPHDFSAISHGIKPVADLVGFRR